VSDGGAATIFRDNFAAAHAIARRLRKSYRQLAGLFPLSPASLSELDDDDQQAVDAFLKRFEQLVSAIQDTLFRGLAVLERESLAGRSRRDVAELMERLGALSSSRRFGEIAVVRNRLAHLYPTDPDRQATNLNAAHAATPDLLAVLDGVRTYAMAKARADLSGFAPVGVGGDSATVVT
jgi:hypothetical protein